VAEWAIDDKGNGRVIGLSAVHRAQAAREGDYTTPPSDYIGLRVFKSPQKSVK